MASPRRPGEPKLLGNISVVCCEYTSCCCGLTVVILLDWVVEISRMTKAEIVSENSPKYTLFFFLFFLGGGGVVLFFYKPNPPTNRYIQQTETIIPITQLLIQNNGSFGSYDTRHLAC